MNPFDRYFNKYDSWYEKPFGKSAYDLEVKCLKSLMEDFSTSLEIGVGTGRFAHVLGIQYGIDTSINMLKIAKERGVKVALAKGENLPFKDEIFDSVFIIVTICFVDNPQRVINEAYRVLRDNGNLYLGLILKESKWAKFYQEKASQGHPLYRHATFYSFFDIKKFVKGKFSFEVIKSTLLDKPQDTQPIKNREIKLGFYENAGFTCLKLKKKKIEKRKEGVQGQY
ncbi:MAG TPA: class I SAM-dependent methyltransferase [Aquifex aeolicus]|nr:class I SAM-dependent methyltransferase [Aquifex aeolicus]